MVTHYHAHKCFFYLLTLLLFTACSGGGDSSLDVSGGGAGTQGIAVDPYIEGAVFQEVDADTGAVLQRQSSPSDGFGLFTFPRPLTPGSVVEMKISNKGLHGGAPYQGMLRRTVLATDEYPVVVSPLTTLLANGASPENIIALFNDAGITGLTTSDLYDDPMEDLPNMTTGITNEHLKRLQAAMAADAYMEVTGNYLAGWNELNDYGQFVIFSNMVSAMKNLLSAGEFENVRAALSNDSDMTVPLILEDFILTVLAHKQTIVAQAKEDLESYGDFNPALVEQAVINAKRNAVVSVKFYYRQRVSASSSHDGAALYNDNCSLCHDYLASTNKPGRSAGAIQAAIDNNVGGMAFLGDLTPDEVQAIADALPQAPVVDPDEPPDGISLYAGECAGCHQPLDVTTKPGRSAAAIQEAIDNNLGGMGFLGDLTTDEVQAIADALPPAPVVNPDLPPDGIALYASECAGCHQPLNSTTKPGRSAAAIQEAIDNNLGGMGFLGDLTTDEVQAIAGALPQAPVVDPDLPPDGIALYASECAGCHQPLNSTTKPGRSAAAIQAAIDNNLGGMGFLSNLASDEVQAIADALPAPPPNNPNQPPNGIALYSSNCAGCHQPLDVTNKPGRSTAEIQAAINNNIGGMGYLSSLTSSEVQAIANVLPAPPPNNPNQPPNGTALYSSNCAGCHQPLDVTSKPGRSAAAIQAAIDNNIGNMGFLGDLTPEEVQAIADVLPAADNPGNDYSDCTLCHGQPPSGSIFPDTAGAHAAHTALASVGNSCLVCHLGAAHNSQVDLGFPAGYDAKSGPANDNLDGTCSSIKCHGGRTTPDWWDGSIVVDTQCTSCHASGSSQYNSYSSGRHSKHIREGYSCTVCHNTSKLRNGHFSNLESSAFELSPAATIGGGSTRVGSYSNGTCSSIDCHGSERWSGSDND